MIAHQGGCDRLSPHPEFLACQAKKCSHKSPRSLIPEWTDRVRSGRDRAQNTMDVGFSFPSRLPSQSLRKHEVIGNLKSLGFVSPVITVLWKQRYVFVAVILCCLNYFSDKTEALFWNQSQGAPSQGSAPRLTAPLPCLLLILVGFRHKSSQRPFLSLSRITTLLLELQCFWDMSPLPYKPRQWFNMFMSECPVSSPFRPVQSDPKYCTWARWGWQGGCSPSRFAWATSWRSAGVALVYTKA